MPPTVWPSSTPIGEAVRQVVMADRLVITKGDLTDTASRARLDARLDSPNPGAPA
ncbi:hypothetical protein [Zoogloea sp.]|uniref:hypothetical protein n=1 Tax=Zoogloea sp. TaxID=49181 RepID=UPI0025D946E0|nr:hypothetical protein [Zoogloea sp.]